MIKLIVLGSTGLLGSTLLKYFSKQSNIKCYGIIRKSSDIDKLKSIKNVKLYKIEAITGTNTKFFFKSSAIDMINTPRIQFLLLHVDIFYTHTNPLKVCSVLNLFYPHYNDTHGRKFYT